MKTLSTIVSIMVACTSGSLSIAQRPQPADPDAKPPAWTGQTPDEVNREAELLSDYAQITLRDRFVKAGEAYFDHQDPPRWIVFQAIPVPLPSQQPDPYYSMYVAKLRYDADRIVGIEQPVLISADMSANTCGWFHPQKPFTVLFGSTQVAPKNSDRPGFRVGTRSYVWQFPEEMEVVERSVEAIIIDLPAGDRWGEMSRTHRAIAAKYSGQISAARSAGDQKKASSLTDDWFAERDKVVPELRAIRNWTKPVPLFERPKYGAECSYSKDGRFVLYAQVREQLTNAKDDADIWIFDTRTGKQHLIVGADGYDGGPFFSPDNTRICYRSDRKGDDKLQLFVADLKFEDGVPVGMEREIQVTANDHVNWAPYWDASGSYLIYGTSEVSHGNYEVFALEAPARGSSADASTLRHRRITFAPGADVLPVFSDNGKWMMWTAQRGAMVEGEAKPSSQVWVARVRTGPGTLADAAGLFAAPTTSGK